MPTTYKAALLSIVLGGFLAGLLGSTEDDYTITVHLLPLSLPMVLGRWIRQHLR